ncbi:MAG: UvrY/SirA/GacA family response regulator transcription factor [Gammaproteobacteria bacterium]|nr:UvrY/SirA/GacA family response regulator transcription factor [Gammaproteobacteria bacterium]MCW8910226.1 UvrY/SirA/GacA family response regulator transcription factor [Gammaproteobacteria bacterium]MCW9004574.1 UvrY/SirA/GacA family response regulator transcription factor [Gammaproteobacteria bacterium]
MANIRVMLVDDHDLIRYGLRRLLEDQSGIEVVAEADSGEKALELARSTKMDVILMDINMPGIGGFEATSRLSKTHPEIKIIVLTAHSEGPLPKRLLEAGAVGFLTKGCDVKEMIDAIQKVRAGQRYIAPTIAQQLALSMLPGEESLLDALSQRELQVLIMISQGMRTNAISDQLNLSPKTVSTYRKRLHEKLDVSNDVEMMRLAIKHGVLDESD